MRIKLRGIMIFLVFILFVNAICMANSGESEANMSMWHIEDAYKYCTTNIDESTSDAVKERYAHFFFIRSVKVQHQISQHNVLE